MKKINCLSLCDGVSVAQIALRKAGIEYNWYIASEIDKHAIKATQHNFPKTYQIGDLNKVDVSKIPFQIDLVLSGTPCTDFSGAGRLAEFSGANGQLFFKFCKILADIKKINPNVKFLFENVASMRKHVREIITTMLGVEPIKINSSLVCAQNRNRYYWTNISDCIEQPEDRGIVLQDILEDDVDEKYHLSETILKRINKDAVLKQLLILKMQREKAYAVMASNNRQTETDYVKRRKGTLEPVSPSVVARVSNSQDGKDFAVSGKSQCLSAGHNNYPKVALAGAIRGRYNNDGTTSQQVELNGSSKSIALTTVEKDNIVVITHNMMPRSSTSGKGGTGHLTRQDGKAYCLDTGQTNAVQIIQVNPAREFGDSPRQQNRVYDSEGKGPALKSRRAGETNIAVGVVNDRGVFRQLFENKSLNIDANYHKGVDNHAARSMVISLQGRPKKNQDKASCFTAGAHSGGNHSGGNHSDMDVITQSHDYLIIRRLTEVEVCRLQGIPDNYFFDKSGRTIIAPTNVYKAVGNGWQSDTIAHILSYWK